MNTSNFDLKRELLTFLYIHKNKAVEVNEVLKQSGLSALNMRYFLRQLEEKGLIQLDPTYSRLGNHTNNGRGPVLSDVNNTKIYAKLTAVDGEDYVERTYLTSPTANVVNNITGNNVQVGDNATMNNNSSVNLNPPQQKEHWLKKYWWGIAIPIIVGLILLAIQYKILHWN